MKKKRTYIYLLIYFISIIICIITKFYLGYFIPIIDICIAKLDIKKNKYINVIFWITVVLSIYYFYSLYILSYF